MMDIIASICEKNILKISVLKEESYIFLSSQEEEKLVILRSVLNPQYCVQILDPHLQF